MLLTVTGDSFNSISVLKESHFHNRLLFNFCMLYSLSVRMLSLKTANLAALIL